MRHFSLLVLAVFAAASAAPAEDPRVEPAIAEARRVSTELMETIRGLLMQELGKGGFTGAVEVCSETAQMATEEFAAQAGRSVRRVSLKYRNPKNAPDTYERRRLAEFERLNREKKLPKEQFEVVARNGAEELRYMRPIGVQPMCLTCHGPAEKIPDEIRAVLNENYPQDLATGYRAGDLRGAVSVRIPLPARKAAGR